MLQASDQKNIDDILLRYQILDRMWMLSDVYNQLKETVEKIKSKEL